MGANSINVQVTAEDGNTSRTYTLVVTRAAPSAAADATLSGLSLSAGTLSPAFAANVTGYTATVGHGVETITVRPATTDTNAAVAYLDENDATLADADTRTTGQQVALSVGANTINVQVTAQDGITRQTYTVVVTRAAAAADATLSGLSLSAGTLAPAFAANLTGYTATVGHGVEAITVRPATADTNATVAYLDENDATLADADAGTTGQQVALSVGANSINVQVTAEDGNTTWTYTLVVTRAAPSAAADATLSGLSLSAGTLAPAFAANVTGYTATVGHGVETITVRPATTDTSAAVAYLDENDATLADADTGATGQQVALSVGANTINVQVTAQDGITRQTYTVVVTRAAPSAAADATLSGLSLSAGRLSPAFAANVTGYTATVGHGVETITVRPATADTDAAVAYLDENDATLADADTRTTGQQVALSVGANTINVQVTAQDGNTSRTYTLVVTRAGAPTDTDTDTDTALRQAWHARFGRTVAEQVIDVVERRLGAARRAGFEGRIAGQDIKGAPRAETRLAELTRRIRGGQDREEDGVDALGWRAVTARDLVTGSAFALTGGREKNGFGTVWGQGAVTRFDGRDRGLALDGEVRSAQVGADWTRAALTAGLMVAHSRGEGSYRSGAGGGEASSTLTGLYPFGRYAVSEGVALWGVMGYGEGTFTLTPEGGAPRESGMALAMAAAGARGTVLDTNGFRLVAKIDAMGVRTSSEAVRVVADAAATVTRLRLGLEGTRPVAFGSGALLTPVLEIGVRQDGGDAETGFGMDLGAGLVWSDQARGLEADVRAGGLLTHTDGGFRERHLAGSLRYDPNPASEEGLAMSLTQSYGARSAGGTEALLGRRYLAGLQAADAGETPRHLEAKVGYGWALGRGRLVGTPELGVGIDADSRAMSLGWRLTEARASGLVFGLGLKGTWREFKDDRREAEQRLAITFLAHW